MYMKKIILVEGERKSDVLAGTKVSISNTIERLKNADGTQGEEVQSNFKQWGYRGYD